MTRTDILDSSLVGEGVTGGVEVVKSDEFLDCFFLGVRSPEDELDFLKRFFIVVRISKGSYAIKTDNPSYAAIDAIAFL